MSEFKEKFKVCFISVIQKLKFKCFRKSKMFKNLNTDVIQRNKITGMDHLRDPRLNKGLSFSLQERQVLGIHGLQPALIKSQEEELELCKMTLMR